MTSVKFGMTKKRVNSTSVTFNSGSVTLDCRLKEPCGTHEPVFIVQGLDDAHRWNYVYWKGAYYWIDEVTYVTNDIKEVRCHLDVLGTFKGAIESTMAYVTYSDKTHYTSYKDDERFGSDHKAIWTGGQGPTGSVDIGLSQSSGTYLMTVQTSSSMLNNGGVVIYAMDSDTIGKVFNGFQGVVYTDIQSWGFNGTNIADFLNNWALKILTGGQQALDNIRSLIYVPIPYSTFTSLWGSDTTMCMGSYSITLQGGNTVTVVPAYYCTTGNAIINLGRPLCNNGHEWLSLPKYCTIKLTHPCGVEEINDVGLIQSNMAYLWWCLNYASGEYSIRVTSESSKDSDTIALITGTIAIDVLNVFTPVNSTPQFTFLDRLMTPTSLLGQFWSQGSAQPRSGGGSVPTGYASLRNLSAGKEIFWDVEYYQPAIFEGNSATEYNAYCDVYGYPCGRYMKIGDNSGYIQTANVSVGNGVSGIAGATEDDIKAINDYLNSGVYIES